MGPGESSVHQYAFRENIYRYFAESRRNPSGPKMLGGPLELL